MQSNEYDRFKLITKIRKLRISWEMIGNRRLRFLVMSGVVNVILNSGPDPPKVFFVNLVAARVKVVVLNFGK